jgi:hypothetical protein
VTGSDLHRERGAEPAASQELQLSPRWHLAAGLIFLLVFGFLATLYYGVGYDDAYITFRYARNLAEGYGFCYNPGTPSMGTTTPFFTLLLAGLASLGADIPAAGSLLTCLSLLLLAVVCYRTLCLEGRPLAGIAAGLSVLVNFRLAKTIGGEPVLLCLLIFAAAYLSEARDRTVPAALLLALAALTRGEGLLAAPVLLAFYVHRRRRIPWAAALVYVSVFGAWLLYSWWTVGALAPSTMSAKMAQGRSGLFHGFWPQFWIWAGRTERINWLWALLLVPAAAGLRRFLRSGGSAAGRVIRAYLLWMLLYLLGYTVLGVAGYHWYSVPVIVGLLFLAAAGLPLGEGRGTVPGRRGKVTAAVTLALLAAFLAVEGRVVWRSAGVEDIYNTTYPLVAERLNKLAGPDESVAYLEIGFLGYLYKGRTLDLLGLTGDIDHDQIARGNLMWGLMKMRPDWYLDMEKFGFMTNFVVDEPWFRETYRMVETVVHPAHRQAEVRIYRRNTSVPMPGPLAVDIVQQRGDEAVSGAAGPVGQSFICDRDGLVRIDVKLAANDAMPENGATVRLREDGPGGRELARVTIPGGWRFGPRRFLPLRLGRPLPLRGQPLYFSIETAGDVRDAPHPAFLSSGEDVYDGGALHVNGKPAKGDLVFRTWHQDPPAPKRRNNR